LLPCRRSFATSGRVPRHKPPLQSPSPSVASESHNWLKPKEIHFLNRNKLMDGEPKGIFNALGFFQYCLEWLNTQGAVLINK